MADYRARLDTLEALVVATFDELAKDARADRVMAADTFCRLLSAWRALAKMRGRAYRPEELPGFVSLAKRLRPKLLAKHPGAHLTVERALERLSARGGAR